MLRRFVLGHSHVIIWGAVEPDVGTGAHQQQGHEHDHITIPLVLIHNIMLELLSRGHDGEGEARAHVQNMLALWGISHTSDDSVVCLAIERGEVGRPGTTVRVGTSGEEERNVRI